MSVTEYESSYPLYHNIKRAERSLLRNPPPCRYAKGDLLVCPRFWALEEQNGQLRVKDFSGEVRARLMHDAWQRCGQALVAAAKTPVVFLPTLMQEWSRLRREACDQHYGTILSEHGAMRDIGGRAIKITSDPEAFTASFNDSILTTTAVAYRLSAAFLDFKRGEASRRGGIHQTRPFTFSVGEPFLPGYTGQPLQRY
ncbi:MAG: hypothetical protein EBZ69_05405, partial [Alphaproteobacteria bacterium]|nr:hypothetical protein [Alphaproteobacteria bacterium]